MSPPGLTLSRRGSIFSTATRALGAVHQQIELQRFAFDLFAKRLPFALVIVAVYLPVIVAMRQARLPGQPVALFALAGMLAGPVAGVLLLTLGQGLVGGRFQPEPSLWQLLGRVFGSGLPQLLAPMVALMLGGAVFGAGFAWACRYAERPFRTMTL